jgi:fibronectin-binding autotransporter adhesin
MSKSKRSLIVVSSAVAPVFFVATAFSAVAVSSYNSGQDASTITNWPSSTSSPPSAVGSNPLVDSGDNGGDGAPYSGSVNETVSPGKVEGETFETGAAGFNLGEIAFVVGGSAATASIHLFQLNSSVTGTSGGYILSTAEVGHDLLGGGSGLSLTLNGAGGYDLDEFVFSGADQVALLPNTEYAVEFWNTGATGTFFLQRGIDQPYLNGQAYQTTTAGAQTDNSTITRGGVSGGGPRNLLFAVYAAPSFTNATWTGAAADGVWGTSGNWSGGVPANIGDQATLGPTITSPTTIDLDGNYTVGVLTLNSADTPYTIAQGTSGTLTLNNGYNGSTVPAQIDDLSGSHTISAPVSIAANGVTVAVGQSGDTLTISGSVGGAGGITLNGTPSSQSVGTTVLSSSNNYGGATTVDSGTLAAGAAGALPSTTSLTIGNGTATAAVQLLQNSGGQSIAGLTINANATLDVGNNHMIISDPGGSIDSAVRAYLVAGYNAGGWNGASTTGGVITTSAATGTKYGLGYADGADGGISGIASGQLEVKYTLYGDTNLDGTVNSIDFGNLAANFGKSGKVWDQGDFDYNGAVNSVDFGLLAGNFGKSLGSAGDVASAADWAALDAFASANGLMSEVPEPSCTALALITAVGMLQRRRSRSRQAESG